MEIKLCVSNDGENKVSVLVSILQGNRSSRIEREKERERYKMRFILGIGL